MRLPEAVAVASLLFGTENSHRRLVRDHELEFTGYQFAGGLGSAAF